MNPDNNYNNNFSKVVSYIDRRRYTDAILLLTELFGASGKNSVISKLKSLNENYSYLKRYALNGSSDPTRDGQLDAIAAELYRFADSYLRSSEAKSSSKEYYSTLRFEASRRDETIESLCNDIVTAENTTRQISLAERLFKRIWVSYPLHQETCDAILNLYKSDAIAQVVKDFLVSSILLGLIQFFDIKRLNLLLSLYLQASENNTPNLAARIACAVVLTLLKYGSRVKFDKETYSLITLCENMTYWKSDLGNAYLCLVHTLETPDINKKILDGFVGGIMKLKPDIEKNIPSIENISDFEDLEENPEWNEILEKSGLAEQMREMAEIQMEGGDVFMSTFSHLKGFPFFYNMVNWFMPFTTENQALSNLNKDESSLKVIRSISKGARFLCNSDKYSLALSLERMPEAQRIMLSGQINMASEAQKEENETEMLPENINRELMIKGYVQDLYRFFNLYTRKTEYINPFELPLDLTSSPYLKQTFSPSDNVVSTAAEFCFAHRHYLLALNLFEYMSDGGAFSESLFQKTGFCYQSLNKHEAALEAYRKAELLNGDNLWTIKKIASILAQCGKHSEALLYFEKYFNSKQENPSAIRSYLLAAISVGDSELANTLYARLEYFAPSPKNTRIASMIRQIEGKLNEAFSLMNSFVNDPASNPKPDDYIDNAILAVYAGKYMEALDSLSVSRETGTWANKTLDEFFDKVYSSLKTISSRIPSPSEFPHQILELLLDSMPRI